MGDFYVTSEARAGWSWCCLYFLLGLFVFSLISTRFVFPISNVFVCNFPEVVCNLNRDSRIGTLKYEKEKMHLDDANEAKFFFFIKTKKKTREKPTARFVVRGGRGLGPAASQSSL